MRFIVLLCLLFAFIQSALANTPTAQQITFENAAKLQRKGPDAIGGINDWHLSNGTLCAVISDVSHEHELSTKGGALVDLGFCGREDDFFNMAQDLLNADRKTPFLAQDIQTQNTANSASVIVTSLIEDVEHIAHYTLDLENPTELKIEKKIRLVGEQKTEMNLLSLSNFNYHSLQPFLFSSGNPSASPGFSNVDFVSRGIGAVRNAARNADTIITPSPPNAEHPITYGWRVNSVVRREGNEITTVPHFALADEESIAMLVLSDDFWIGDGSKIGWLQLPQIPLMSLDTGSVLEISETIFVGKQASVSSATNQILNNEPIIKGRGEPNTAVHLLTEDGHALSHHRIDRSGEFMFRAPIGNYTLKHRGSAQRSQMHVINHEASGTDIGALKLPKSATLELPKGTPMRLKFIGINGTANPDFADPLTDFQVDSGEDIEYPEPVNNVFLAGVESDPTSVALAAGSYQIFATHGLEFSVENTTISLNTGERKTLEIKPPKREIETPGRIAADLHVHAGDSFDNAFSNTERVRSFVAENGEIMVNSEHDVVVNFAPLVEQMGVGDKISAFTGIEMTSLVPTQEQPFTGGHANFFPFAAKPLEYRKGMIAHESRRLREVIDEVKKQSPNAVAQLNHPRINLDLSDGAPSDYQDLVDDGAFLDHMGAAGYPYDPSKPLDTEHNRSLIEPHPHTGTRDLDFDAMELVNPGGPYHNERITAVRRDWISFLLQGERITGTANSDSHNGTQQVAIPLNMVAVSNDDVRAYSEKEFLDSIKSGNSFGTNGPMIDVNLSGKQMGETFAGKQAQLNLNIYAASWVPMHTATVEVNGKVIKELDLSQQKQWQVDLKFTQDSFVTIQVHGESDELYHALFPEMPPYAFSNPIFVDADGNGHWQAPGLSE